MKLIEESKFFEAVTYDNHAYHFVVTPEGKIFCIEFEIEVPAEVIEIKPNFVLRKKCGRSIYSLDDHARNQSKKKSLISRFVIDDDVFEYLINNGMIRYCTDMALLYGFDRQYAYDAPYQKNAFKSYKYNPKKRARMLENEKKGRFNPIKSTIKF